MSTDKMILTYFASVFSIDHTIHHKGDRARIHKQFLKTIFVDYEAFYDNLITNISITLRGPWEHCVCHLHFHQKGHKLKVTTL